MRLSQKTFYALRALLELARRRQGEPVSIAAIGQAQDIPAQFLQVIMRELRQGGFVESRRGKEGGYLLASSPTDLTMGDVIRFLEGSVAPVDLGAETDRERVHGAFLATWLEVQTTVDEIYDRTSFQDLVERDRERRQRAAPDYVI